MHRAETQKVLETGRSTKSRCCKCGCGMNSLCFRFFPFVFSEIGSEFIGECEDGGGCVGV